MNVKTTQILKKLTGYVLIYGLFAAVILYFNMNKRYLIFNTALSFIPLVITSFLLTRKGDILTFFGFIASAIFYPNALYMFTDFIHIKTSDFYNIYGGEVVYVTDALQWIELAAEVGLIVLSLVVGYETFVNFLKLLKCYEHKVAAFILLIFTSGATAVGIYVGRFLRLNSWEVLQLPSIVQKLITSYSDNDLMLLLTFASLHFVIILLFANLKRD
ncbi:DUF1361 domain-containing protein [Peptoniphilus equinus]|uniref:DUF1361 domain-containing protein n=1 Tax=Peptoniphilus equinus TaxID=3016343 RepID=A0ABY7QTH2_9FIRM|nr:DUF1361 domain-containing protein [Peptoniphilus equinus]WBW50072.1 DUF1361 domain-containing protein [Peptoniphilus equinus]